MRLDPVDRNNDLTVTTGLIFYQNPLNVRKVVLVHQGVVVQRQVESVVQRIIKGVLLQEV